MCGELSLRKRQTSRSLRLLERVGFHTEDRREAREDLRFLRRLRRATNGAAAKIGCTVLPILTGGMLIVIWAGRAEVIRLLCRGVRR